MSKRYCDYQGCRNVRNTHGNITFFTLPNDERRVVWIENSGNEALKLINNKSVRFICEEHFERHYLRHQFLRTTLSKNAVPIKYLPEKDCSLDSKQNIIECNTNMSLDTKDIKAKEFDIILKSNIKETENSDNSSKDYIEYDIEYYGNDSNSNETQKDNLVQIDPSNVINEEIYQTNSSIYNDELLFEENNCENENQNEIFGYDAYQHGEESNYLVPSKSKKNFNQNKNLSKKIRKNSGTIEIASCSSNEITSSTIDTNSKIETLELNTVNNQILDLEFHCNEEPNISKCAEENIKIQKAKHEKDYEEDKHFALSLVGNFQRLPLQKKALAKVKILQYLTNLEFSDAEPLDI